MRNWSFAVWTVIGIPILFACSEEHAANPVAPDTEPLLSNEAGVTYSGHATAVRASVLGNEVVLSEAGPLPPSGGADEASLLSVRVPKLLTAEVLHAAAVGQGWSSRSEASAAKLDLRVAGNRIRADFLMARASAICTRKGKTRLRGEAVIEALVINGKRILVTALPNQMVDLGIGQVIINEQSRTSNSITVTALHVVIPGTADIVIASAHADLEGCVPHGNGDGCPPRHGDFITGSGLLLNASLRADIALAAGLKDDGTLWGHFDYSDSSGLTVESTGITQYKITGESSRQIHGTALINGEPGSFVIDFIDKGDGGDVVRIKLSIGLVIEGTIEIGDIELHKREPCPEGDS